MLVCKLHVFVVMCHVVKMVAFSIVMFWRCVNVVIVMSCYVIVLLYCYMLTHAY